MSRFKFAVPIVVNMCDLHYRRLQYDNTDSEFGDLEKPDIKEIHCFRAVDFLRQCAVSNSDLFKGRQAAKISETVGFIYRRKPFRFLKTAFKASRLFGRRPILLHLSGLLPVKPSACGWGRNLPPQITLSYPTQIIPYLFGFVKNFFVFYQSVPLFIVNLHKCYYRIFVSYVIA